MYRTALTILCSYVCLAIFVIPIVSTSLFKKTSNIPHIFARQWARFTLTCSGSNVDVIGKENIPAGPVIYMANHSSYFDILSILGHLDVQFRWIAKKELFNIPGLGTAMKGSGYIAIDRGNHEKALKSINMAAEKIRSGTSIFMFPEGKRSMDGVLRHPFKKGGFHLSLKSKAPIVPIAIIGVRDILPKGRLIINQGNIKLVIGSPIYPELHDLESLMEETFRSIKNASVLLG
ncbi:MAG: lysophospholipid acyltransferase family protein [Smithella sp.]